jgi:hypothetical protein
MTDFLTANHGCDHSSISLSPCVVEFSLSSSSVPKPSPSSPSHLTASLVAKCTAKWYSKKVLQQCSTQLRRLRNRFCTPDLDVGFKSSSIIKHLYKLGPKEGGSRLVASRNLSNASATASSGRIGGIFIRILRVHNSESQQETGTRACQLPNPIGNKSDTQLVWSQGVKKTR